jgi:hypothetical protein
MVVLGGKYVLVAHTKFFQSKHDDIEPCEFRAHFDGSRSPRQSVSRCDILCGHAQDGIQVADVERVTRSGFRLRCDGLASLRTTSHAVAHYEH